MKKLIVIGMFTFSLALTGCGATQKEQENQVVQENQVEQIEQTEAVAFTDDLGREVTVKNPQRVATLVGSFADMWQLAGGDVCATADDAWDDLQLELSEDTVNLGGTKDINMEALFEAEPDFIIASSMTKGNMEMLETFEATGIPTAFFEVSGFEDYLRVLKVFTEITGREDLYEKNGLEVQKQVEQVISKSRERLQSKEAPSVLVLRVSATSMYAKGSKNTVLSEMLYALGCENIADKDESLLETISLEHILQQDPDYIFTVQQGDDTEGTQKNLDSLFAEDAAWSSLTAVKENRWYHMDKRLYNLKPNARWGEAYEGLEKILESE